MDDKSLWLEVSPAPGATDHDVLTIEEELESLIGGPWTESEDRGGRIVYRHLARAAEARRIAGELEHRRVSATIRLLPFGL